MKTHSYAKFLIEQEIKKIEEELRLRYLPNGLGIARALNNDIMELEHALKLLESQNVQDN